MCSFKIYSIWLQASKLHPHVRNAVTVVWGLLRLTPTKLARRKSRSQEWVQCSDRYSFRSYMLESKEEWKCHLWDLYDTSSLQPAVMVSQIFCTSQHPIGSLWRVTRPFSVEWGVMCRLQGGCVQDKITCGFYDNTKTLFQLVGWPCNMNLVSHTEPNPKSISLHHTEFLAWLHWKTATLRSADVNAVILSFDPNKKQSLICERKTVYNSNYEMYGSTRIRECEIS